MRVGGIHVVRVRVRVRVRVMVWGDYFLRLHFVRQGQPNSHSQSLKTIRLGGCLSRAEGSLSSESPDVVTVHIQTDLSVFSSD